MNIPNIGSVPTTVLFPLNKIFNSKCQDKNNTEFSIGNNELTSLKSYCLKFALESMYVTLRVSINGCIKFWLDLQQHRGIDLPLVLAILSVLESFYPPVNLQHQLNVTLTMNTRHQFSVHVHLKGMYHNTLHVGSDILK